ncbi:hypothetical protein FRB91_009011 [Serendipita sp. 411]|nr:hypothetical protein FRC18_000614 [Serendipita sp. 400]KAG8819387.1 hypothetical protein FRC19_009807 [Serendipita sp. 401]KAG8850495.1 hypothetical protein FRB91_009011 [Serendipita sp. 411]
MDGGRGRGEGKGENVLALYACKGNHSHTHIPRAPTLLSSLYPACVYVCFLTSKARARVVSTGRVYVPRIPDSYVSDADADANRQTCPVLGSRHIPVLLLPSHLSIHGISIQSFVPVPRSIVDYTHQNEYNNNIHKRNKPGRPFFTTLHPPHLDPIALFEPLHIGE